MKPINKNIWREFMKSKGRFLSITSLLTLSLFVFIGLNVTGANMRATAQKLYEKNQLADAKVTSSLPLTQEDQTFLSNLPEVATIEFGQSVDVVEAGSTNAVRIERAPKTISTFDLVKGRAPKNEKEIVLSSNMQENVALDDSITFASSKKDTETGLKQQTFKIVGFVHSSEYLKRDTIGSTRAGTGQLAGFAYVNKEAFSSDEPYVARLLLKKREGQAYSKTYEKQISDEVDAMQVKTTAYQNQKIKSKQAELTVALDEGQEKINTATRQLTDAMTTILDNLAKITTQIEQIRSSNQRQLLETLEGQRQQLTIQKVEIDQKMTDLKEEQEKIDEGKRQAKQLSSTTLLVQSRNDYNDGYNSYGEDTHRLDVLARIFPVFFFLVAVLVSFTTMRRMVEEKRIEMGALRALGYSKREVMREFIVYSFATAIIGTVLGSYFGLVFLPINIFKTYQANFTFEKISLAPHYGVVCIGFFIAFCSTVFASYTAARKELKTIPAQLMQPKLPAKGSRILLERFPLLWKKMTFSQKVTARNLFRYKGRMFMTILGVAGATALMITGFGIKDSLNTIADRQFGKISKFDLIVSYNAEDTEENVSEVKQFITDSKDVKAFTPAFFSAITTKVPKNHVREKIVLIVPETVEKLEEYIQLRDVKTGKKMTFSSEGVILSEKLAKVQNVSVGDSLPFYDSNNQEYKVKVAGITTMYAGHYMYMNPSYYEKVMKKKPKNNSYLVKLQDGSLANTRKVAAEFNKKKAAYDVVQAQESKGMITNILKNMDNLILVMVISASMLSIIVLYTLTNVNVGERVRELSTLKVLGFYPKEVLFYIYRETNLLTFLGMIVGIGIGYELHAYIMAVMPPANAMVAPGLTWKNIGYSILLTGLFSVVVMLLMNRKIQKVDMLEALKSMD